jgi:hypothetical protein
MIAGQKPKQTARVCSSVKFEPDGIKFNAESHSSPKVVERILGLSTDVSGW